MGKQTRRRPQHLPQKLLQIRQTLGLSQNGMVGQMRLSDEIERDYISKYERGTLEPTLNVLLKYAEAAGVWVDVLIDDDLDLPTKMPSRTKHEGVKRIATTRRQG